MNHPRPSKQSHTHRPVGPARGFTIIEMLVTIGILVIVAAGVATIFASVGDVVSKGRKLSELNQFAARIERVMRDDFESMTRDGFLVIVNKNANSGNDVKLYRGQQSDPDKNLFGGFSDQPGQIRRSDEIMFFTRGDYQTARRAIAPSMVASSSEAAIYYGLGQKRRPDLTTNVDSSDNYFFNPQPWDNNFDNTLDTRLGVETPGFVNPNEFARDWSLLRQVTLLVNPVGHGQRLPQEAFGLFSDDPTQRPFLRDSGRQIALQPAARSIFTALSGSSGYANHWLYDTSGAGPTPVNPAPSYRVSGQVDIVTQDLASVRTMVQALAGGLSPVQPSDYFNYAPRPPQPANPPVIKDKDTFDTEYAQDPLTSPKPSDALNLDLGSYTNIGAWNSGNASQIDAIRKWMIDALPSRWNLSITSSAPSAFDFTSGVRYEDIPTRLQFNDTQFANSDRGRIQRAYAEANQEMLGASVFVPRCTEFVVEWSYGFVNNSITNPTDPRFKQLIWYGLDRYVDSNNDGQLDQSDARAAVPYTQRTIVSAGTNPANTHKRPQGPEAQLIVGKNRPMTPGGNPAPLSPDQVEIATFGFNTKADKEGAVWPWPKLIRITMKLADPTDRDIEQTYQVVFDVPEPE